MGRSPDRKQLGFARHGLARGRGAARAFLALSAAACGDSASQPAGPAQASPSPGLAPAALVADSDTLQDAVVTSQVVPPSVRVLSSEGERMPGVDVTFEVIEGGGTLQTATARTDGAGQASAGRWTLGAVAGENLVRARITGLAPVHFRATGRAAAARRIASISGTAQAGTAGHPVPVAPAVQVQDAHGNGVEGELVRFVARDGSTVGGGDSVSVTSGPDGRAAAPDWVLGPAAGPQRLEARAGSLGSVTFTATAGAGRAAQVALTAGAGQTAEVGTAVAVPPGVTVRDSSGNPVPGVAVGFAITAGDGTLTGPSTTTDSAGVASVGSWTLGTTAGANRLTVSVGPAGTLEITVEATGRAGPAAAIQIAAGDGQTASSGAPVPIDPAVQILDAFGNAVAGAGVTFSIQTGGGSASGTSRTTGATGIAAVGRWTLGSAGTNTLRATAQGAGISGNPVTFTATATTAPAGGGDYSIEFRLNAGTTLTAGQQAAFDQARARWESVISGDLPDVALNRSAGTCGASDPIAQTVDDLLIIVEVVAIDGVGGVLGSAGPCIVRSSRLTVVGRMRLDLADLVALETNGRLAAVVLHEMGHVIGIGTIWSAAGLLADPVSAGGTDPHFTGSGARAAFDAAGGSSYAGATVPVELLGGSGTADGHWRESVFDDEIMTGWIDPGVTPLSAVTVESLADLGYSVNGGAADGFSIPVSMSTVRRSGPARGLHLPGDIDRIPIEIVGPDGQRQAFLPLPPSN